ncbi:MAG: hypothetical protein ABW292_22245 [Vicinamibacterales bacterium]
MAPKGDVISAETTCAVRVAPSVVEADAQVTLQVKVSCSPVCDLRGHTLLIKDHAGADVTRIELARFDGTATETDAFAVKAPFNPGRYTWSVVSPAVIRQRVSCPEATSSVSFDVMPHTTNVVVWDIPSAIVAGEKFKAKVGIKCAHECSLAGRDFEVWSDEATVKGRGTLSDDCWPGTSALYVGEVELEAPLQEGLYAWRVKGLSTLLGAGASTSEIPHAEGSTNFGVRVVTNPECLVTVEAIDQVSQAPVSGARVVMHPYRAVTDEHGVAHVRVAKGAYQLFVSQARYVTFGLPVEVAADMTARAELFLEPVQERN